MTIVRSRSQYDAVIVGGGPAGLNAALVLARCGRRVLVIDAGKPRNYASKHLHNFLSRDGVDPTRLLTLGREELAGHNVELMSGKVVAARCGRQVFSSRVGGVTETLRSRTLLLATGVKDELPAISNAADFYGHGVHHCPYCDAWEHRGQPMCAYGVGPGGVGLAMSLQTWSPHVTVVTNGVPLTGAERRRANKYDLTVRTDHITELRSARGRLAPTRRDPLGSVGFAPGPPIVVSAMFFNTEKLQRSTLPLRLGCRLNAEGGVVHDRKQRTGVRGLYLAGDASFDVQFAIVAAAEGAKAGVAMNRDMQDWDRTLSIKPADR